MCDRHEPRTARRAAARQELVDQLPALGIVGEPAQRAALRLIDAIRGAAPADDDPTDTAQPGAPAAPELADCRQAMAGACDTLASLWLALDEAAAVARCIPLVNEHEAPGIARTAQVDALANALHRLISQARQMAGTSEEELRRRLH